MRCVACDNVIKTFEDDEICNLCLKSAKTAARLYLPAGELEFKPTWVTEQEHQTGFKVDWF